MSIRQPSPRAARFSRRRCLGAAGFLAVPTLAACGRPQEASSSTANVSRAPVTLEHVDWWGPTTPVLTTYFEGIKRDFEAQHPHVTINYAFVQGGTAGVREKWVVNAAGGTPHDSSQVSVAFIRDLMEGGMVEPLDAYTAKTPDMALSHFVDSGQFFNTYEGKHYGVPYDGPAMNVIGYNLDHFRDAGLDPSPTFTWSWTADQFVEAGRRLVKAEGQHVARGAIAPIGLSVAGVLPWLYAHGGDFYSRDYTKTMINDQKGRQAVQLLLDLRYRHNFASNVDGATFETEGYSMVLTGSWTAGYLLDRNPQLRFGYAPIPKGPLATRPSSQTWTNQWSMTKAGKHKDAAWTWLSFVNAEPTLERYFAGVLKRTAGRKAFYQSAAWKNVVKEYPALDGIEKLEPMSKEYPWVRNSEIERDTADAWRKCQANEVGVNETLAQVEQIVNRLLGSQRT